MSTKRRHFALWTGAALAASALLAGGAHAECTGGPSIKGRFGTTINGPLVGGSTAEVYNGILTANGKCGLSGSLTGGVFGQPSATVTVTGTYAVPANLQGSASLLLPGSATPVAFDLGLTKDAKAAEVTGIAINGPAIATIDMTAIASKTYSLSSISGTYIATCTGAGNSGSGGLGSELVYFTFDGGGNVSVLSISNNNGTMFSNPLSGTYAVSHDGSFSIGYPGANARYVVSGELVNGGTELRAVFVDTDAGFGPYRSCGIRKQS